MDDSVFNGYDVTEKMMKSYKDNGFIIIKNILPPDELAQVREALENPKGVRQHAYDVEDGDNEGMFSRMTCWNSPGDDITGLLARSDKIAGIAEKLLGEDIYHYHSKLMMKEARTGGRWQWHQDYGYWYQNGIMFPKMMTINIAIDKSHKINGCLQVLKGSHKMGRVDHVLDGQLGVEPERLKLAQGKFEKVYAELNPGDAIFFDCNLLHSSSPNTSEFRRWMLAMCFNTKSNNPVKAHHHPFYTPLQRVPNSAIKACKDPLNMNGKDFLDPKSSTLADQNITKEIKT
ncbi:unnamed protein product [Owenia fusiformis]|uniref:Uncharacterized protein n=1 Tax=Owenia fusiformis TaxID=6347 RepID=A0A8J1UWB4_OWEFU|nr:unnamed protein product [Owenia fusiformis]